MARNRNEMKKQTHLNMANGTQNAMTLECLQVFHLPGPKYLYKTSNNKTVEFITTINSIYIILKLTCALPFDTTLLSVFMSKQVIWCSVSRARNRPCRQINNKIYTFHRKNSNNGSTNDEKLTFYHWQTVRR